MAEIRPVPRGDETKYRLAEAMRECMQTASVDGITVRQICGQCGLSRQTFYRNFLDKYDLINWYFNKILHQSFEHMGNGRTIREGLERKFEYIEEERLFFAAAFRSDDQNSLKEYDYELILQFYTRLITEKTKQPPDKDTQFLLEMYCRGSIAMTVKWVLGGMKESPSWLAGHLVDGLPSPLKELFHRLGLIEQAFCP